MDKLKELEKEILSKSHSKEENIQIKVNPKTGKLHSLKCLKCTNTSRSRKRMIYNRCANTRDEDPLSIKYINLFDELADLETGIKKYWKMKKKHQ
ncbi:hypothetical protein M0812_25185 [Anaeramoeba flamelloides]|uniref:Uncharacterized protein n=1 Tax=Anaeramoeba flamelloides TaxID=1746091 RepID=A0AAV7YLC2_9EUKA|nr:hypothetical protein M0812_25185 [Anaeramoeba flamelloides]